MGLTLVQDARAVAWRCPGGESSTSATVGKQVGEGEMHKWQLEATPMGWQLHHATMKLYRERRANRLSSGGSKADTAERAARQVVAPVVHRRWGQWANWVRVPRGLLL